MAMILLWFAQVQGTLQGGAKAATPSAAPPVTLLTVKVSPATISVTAGSTTTFTVLGTYTNSSTADVTSMCAWNSSNSAVATIGAVSNPQIVNANTAGTATITCSVGNISDTAQITVTGLTITSPMPSLSGTEGTAFTATFVANGGTAPYTFTITTGLSALQGIGLSFSSPTLSGTLHTPSAGTYPFTVTASDSGSLTTSRVFSLSVTAVGAVSRYPKLPQVWADPHEADLPNPCDAAHNCYVKTIPGDYPCTLAGLQASMDDWAAQPNNVWWHVMVDDGFGGGTRCVINAASAWQFRPKTNGQPTGFYIIESAHPNVRGRIVCARLVPATLSIAGPSARNDGCATTPGIDDIQHMWKLTGTSANGAISSVGNINTDGYAASNIVIRDAEITTSSSTAVFIIEITGCSSTTSATICGLNGSSSYLTPRTTVPSKVGFEYNYIHGTSGDDGKAVALVAQALRIGSQLSWAEWNYFDKVGRSNTTGGTGEGQVIAASVAWRGIKIAHNFVEGGEITMMFGGARPFFWAVPTDIEIRGNFFTRNPAWMWGPSSPVGNNCTVSVKNSFEIKLGDRYLVDGNVMENSVACGQYGQAAINNMPGDGLSTPAPGGAQGFPGANITNITISSNVFRHAVNGYQGGSRSPGLPGSGDGVGHPMKYILFRNNLFYDINNAGGARRGQATANVIQMGNGQSPNWLCTATRDSAGQTATLECENNQLTVCTTTTPPICQPAGPTWNTNLNTDPGNLVSIKGCTPSSFDVPTDASIPSTSVSYAWPLTPALPGTSPVNTPVPPLNYLPGRTLVYHSAGPPNETGTGCILRVSYGSPFDFSVEHNTFLFSGDTYFPAPMGGTTWGGTRTQDFRMVDNVLVNNPTGGNIYIPSNTPQGLDGQTAFFDVNSLEWHHLYFSYTSRTPTQGTATSGSNAGIQNFPGHGAPSFTRSDSRNTLWMTGAGLQICPNPTADTTCLGMNGLMGGTAWIRDPNATTDPLVFFSLVPSSVYKAGGARQASDGTDMGADMEHIRHALQRTIYDECSTVATAPNYCGPTGPRPD